jgi:hypothetical protein
LFGLLYGFHQIFINFYVTLSILFPKHESRPNHFL